MKVRDDPEKYHHDEKNKDTQKCPLGRNAYNDAVSAAGKHTYDFLMKLKNELSGEEWNKLIGKPSAKPLPSVRERRIEELPPWPKLPPGRPWEWTPPDCFEVSIHYSSNWTTSLIVLEGLPSGVTFLSSNPEPSLLYAAPIGSPDNPPVTLVLWNFTSLEGGSIGSVDIEYTIRVAEEAITHPSVTRRCEYPIPGCVLLYGEIWETDADGIRYVSSIGGQQSIVLEFKPTIEEGQEDAINDLVSIYTGQTAPLESYIPHFDIARTIISVYPQWFKFTLKLVGQVPERPESFTSFTIGVDKDGDMVNNCPDMPFDGVDTIYSVLYSLEGGSWKIEKSSYKGFWAEVDTIAGFQISEERDALVLWVPRAELGLSQALRWKVVTEVDSVGDKAPNEETYVTPVSICRLTVKALPRTWVKIAGVNYTADPAGEVRRHVKAGDISVEVEPQVSILNDTRKVFSRWSDGSRSNPRVISIDRDTTLTMEFDTEYLINVASDYGEIAQSTWLREGSVFAISAPTIVTISTGSRVVFNGWVGDLVTSEPTVSLTVNWPVSLVATWRPQHIFSLSFRDKAGRSISPSLVRLSGPSGVLNLTSYEAWVDEGEWRIEEVWYKGVDVHPILGASYDVSEPLEIDVTTEVYDAKLVLKDAAGNPVSNAVVHLEITFPDGTTQTMAAETSSNGTLIIPSLPQGEHAIKFSYQGQEVEVLVDASAGTVEEVSIPITEAFPIPIPFILVGVSAVLSLAALTYLVLYWMCFITRASLKKAEKEAEEKTKELSEARKDSPKPSVEGRRRNQGWRMLPRGLRKLAGCWRRRENRRNQNRGLRQLRRGRRGESRTSTSGLRTMKLRGRGRDTKRAR
ncbi:MAG: carboxypeptidase-like regulatory domain-containing protein [Thermoproteota archaeon]